MREAKTAIGCGVISATEFRTIGTDSIDERSDRFDVAAIEEAVRVLNENAAKGPFYVYAPIDHWAKSHFAIRNAINPR